jgi:hypothetical protein
MGDSINVVGLSSLIESDINDDINVDTIEKHIIQGSNIIRTLDDNIDIEDEYNREIAELSAKFDMNILNGSVDNQSLLQNNDGVDNYNFDSNIEYGDTSDYNNAANDVPMVDPFKSLKNGSNNQTESTYDDGDDYAMPIHDTQLNKMTQEEKKQKHINLVLKGMGDSNDVEFNMDKERDEDDKTSLLEQIDMLRITLEDDGVDISNVPEVFKNSSLSDIQNVYKILRLKNDRNRYCSFAEELILSGAYGLECLFDGEKEWFNRKPDLTNWSDTVKVKLRRMRYETSTFVQEIMQEYNMSSGIRLCLELIPSMFLYSRNRMKTQHDNLASDVQYKEAMSDMNNI